MRKSKVKTVTKQVLELSSITCNKCGKTHELHGEEHQREWQAEEFQGFSCSFGYGSKYDMETWSFDLCESCLKEFVNTFKIKPSGYGEA